MKVNELKAVISQKSNEVIAFNEQLKENTIQQTQQTINELINASYSIQNKWKIFFINRMLRIIVWKK